MAHLEVTENCNHRCTHCYRLDSDPLNRPHYAIEDEIIINNVRKLIEGGILQIIITGGEPLIKKELVKKIIRISVDKGVSISINTNLTLADDDIINFLRTTNTRILTSCPSGVEETFKKITLTNNFECFQKNLIKVINAGIKTAVNMVVTKENKSEIRDTAAFLKSLGCTSFCLTPVALNMCYPNKDLLLSKEEIHDVIYDLLWIENELGMKVDILDGLPKCIIPSDILKEQHLFLYRRCQAGRTFVAVSPNGDVRPCANTLLSYGNINESGLVDIWNKMYKWRTEAYIPSQCEGCLWINRCLGGCRANAMALNRRWDAPDLWEPNPIKVEPPSHSKTIQLNDNTVLRTNKNIKIRKEGDDAYLAYCIDHKTFCMFNRETMDFIDYLDRNGSLSYRDILSSCSRNQDKTLISDIITLLIKYKIIKT